MFDGKILRLIRTSITLPSVYLAIIEDLVETGNYPSKGEIVRVAIRRAIERDEKKINLMKKKSS